MSWPMAICTAPSSRTIRANAAPNVADEALVELVADQANDVIRL